MSIDLSDVSCLIFDHMLNVRHVYDYGLVLETASIILGKVREELKEDLNRLKEAGYIIEKNHQWLINPSNESQIKEILEEFLKSRNITLESCLTLISEKAKDSSKLALLIKSTSKISEWEERKYISFSDYSWESDVGHFCEDLVKNGIMFRESSSSRKHSYRRYCLRVWPFDAKEMIMSVINKRMNVEGISEEEWNLISLLLLSPHLKLKYETLKGNVDLSEPELREIITRLKGRAIIEEKYNEINLPEGLKEPFFQYFNSNIYPQIKQNVVNNLKRKISKVLSNLWIFTGVKRIYESPKGEEKLQPFKMKILNKNEITDTQLISEAKKLNIVLELENNVVILIDIIKEIENWLKSSIKETLIYIPAEDTFIASNTLRNIFKTCEEYVKIQDPYLGEETFYALRYIPNDIRIEFLTGIEIGRDEDFDRICKWIERFKAERRGKFTIFFMGDSSGIPPFHDRFIISKNKGWQVGTSLKQIGRGKDTVIGEISKRDKDEIIEQVFDRWWNVKLKELERKTLTKLNFQKWMDHYKH